MALLLVAPPNAYACTVNSPASRRISRSFTRLGWLSCHNRTVTRPVDVNGTMLAPSN